MAPARSEPVVPTNGGRGEYAERLTLPWWAWPAAALIAALLAAEIWLGSAGIRAWLPFVVLLPVTLWALWWLGRVRVAVADGELCVDDARLPVRFVADAIALDAAGRREVLGVGADPLAFVVQRPWIAGAVQVVLDDPADPTPFWVVSSRHPVQLAAAILAAWDTTAARDTAATPDTIAARDSTAANGDIRTGGIGDTPSATNGDSPTAPSSR